MVRAETGPLNGSTDRKKGVLLQHISGVNFAPGVSETLQKSGNLGCVNAVLCAPCHTPLSSCAMHGESAQGWHGKLGMSKLLS